MAKERTETKIKQAAREVFLKKGMTGARMQEIADTAGINKALLHYYYRNKEQLFNAVFEEIMREFFSKLLVVYMGELSLEEKVSTLTGIYIDFLSQHKELPLFVLSELQRDPKRLIGRLQLKQHLRFDKIQEQLDEQAKARKIVPIRVESFILNIVSLLVFPFVARNIMHHVLGIDEGKFDLMMEERKKEIPKFIMKALQADSGT